MPRHPRSAIAALILSPLLASCSVDLGTITGSLPGVSKESSAPPAPATGGVLSGAIGADLDEGDRQRAFAAEVQALEYGQAGLPIGWRGESTSRHGTIVPGAPYEARGTRCRDFTHTIYTDGKPQTARGTACRKPDGTWGPVG
jgi:surface antigen